MRGALSTVWFDRHKISRDCPEDRESIDDMCNSLGLIIQGEVNTGIPKHRIVIGMDVVFTSLLLHVKCENKIAICSFAVRTVYL